MTGSQAASFALAAGILTLLPGPDSLLILRTTLVQGRRDASLTAIGICAGLFVHASVSALGIAALLAHSARAFAFFQTLGALYLGFLGIRSLRTAFGPELPVIDIAARSCEATSGRPTRLLLAGFLCNVLNPKAMLFYAALLPQFLRPTDPVFVTSLLLTSIHWCEGMVWLGVLIVSLDRIRHHLLNPRTLRILEGSTGALLCGIALRMGVERIVSP